MAMQIRKRSLIDVLKMLNPQERETAPKILVRVDFNVPMKDGVIADDARIRGALPTIEAILRSNCNAILISHMGRPKLVQKGEDPDGHQRAKLSLRLVAARLAALLDTPVVFGEDCLGLKAKAVISAMPSEGGGVVLLENLRFYKQEEMNDANFARELASYADAYINDAFGTCHRAHASTAGVPAIMDTKLCGIGSLVASELDFLDFSHLNNKGELVAAIVGGSKVSSKLPVIRGLLKQVDTLILGGALAFTFLKAQGIPVGSSLVEEGMVDTALELLQEAKANGKNLVLPVDAVCANSFPQGPMKLEDTKTFDLVPGAGIEDGFMGLDVGPKTVAAFAGALDGMSKVVFNGKLDSNCVADPSYELRAYKIHLSIQQVPWESSKYILSTKAPEAWSMYLLI
jgi:phosphoglycerate kinase